MRRDWLDMEEEEEVPEEKKEPKLTRGEMTGALLAILGFGYAAVHDDVPVLFLSLAFLLYLVRPFVAAFGGKNGQAASNVLKGFSLTLFLGAVVLAFL